MYGHLSYQMLSQAAVRDAQPQSMCLPAENVAAVEPNGACQNEEGIGYHCHVAKVHQHGDHPGDVQLGPEVEHRVQEQVDG